MATRTMPQETAAKIDAGQLSLPEFVELPPNGHREHYSSLKRGALNLLILPSEANSFRPPVKSISLRRPGLNRGKRLIVLQGEFGRQLGLLTYLRKVRDEQPAIEQYAAANADVSEGSWSERERILS